MKRVISLVGLGFLCSAALMPAANAQVVGAATAVQPEASQTPDGGIVRAFAAGDPVALLDLIATSASGVAQILFDDDSTLSLGPNSEVVVDDFVYGGGGGSMSLSLATGTLRYIGGHISKGDDVEIDTPQGTVGVRGGMVLVEVGTAATWAAHQYGILTCSGGGQSQVITTRGFACVIDPDGVRVVEVPRDKYDALLQVMAGLGGSEEDGVTGLIDLFCDSGFAENHKDCLAPPGGLAHTQGEELGEPDLLPEQDTVPEINLGEICDLNPNYPGCGTGP